jgi:hypothetical protein
MRKRRSVIVGDEFELHDLKEIERSGNADLEIIEINNAIDLISTRKPLVYTVIGTFIGSMAVGTGIGLHDGTFNEISSVWAVGSGPVLGILGFYFGKLGSR